MLPSIKNDILIMRSYKYLAEPKSIPIQHFMLSGSEVSIQTTLEVLQRWLPLPEAAYATHVPIPTLASRRLKCVHLLHLESLANSLGYMSLRLLSQNIRQ